MFARIACGLTLALLTACAEPQPRCPGGLGQPMLVFELFFGRSVAGRGDVTEREWTTFIEDTVTPALPNGFTVFDARGAWLSPRTGRTIHEATKVILVALPDTAAGREAVNQLRAVYGKRFNQQSIGMTAHPACGTF